MMTRCAMVTAAVVLLSCGSAFAQVGVMGSPTPSVGATSPLGMTPGSSVAPTGLPMGATQLASPGLSPLPCTTTGSASSAMSGSTTTFDGGGTGMGTGSSLPGSATMSGPCGTTASSNASSAAATSPTTPGGAARTGIPLGSFEIGSGGVSPMPVAPGPSIALSPMPPMTAINPSAPAMASTPPCTPAATNAAGLPITVISPTPGIGPLNNNFSASGLPGTTGSC